MSIKMTLFVVKGVEKRREEDSIEIQFYLVLETHICVALSLRKGKKVSERGLEEILHEIIQGKLLYDALYSLTADTPMVVPSLTDGSEVFTVTHSRHSSYYRVMNQEQR